MLTLFQLATIVLVLTALAAWTNARFLRLPVNIALLLAGLWTSMLILLLRWAYLEGGVAQALISSINQIDFRTAVMDGILAFVLFAGALHVDIALLRNRALAVGFLATVGAVVSALVVSTGLWLTAQLFSLPLNFAWCMVFGTLIAPTDPVAVLATLKSVNIEKSLETDMAGEALFNDGIGVVLFTLTLSLAVSGGDFGWGDAAHMLALEAGGGALFGLLVGYAGYHAMKQLDDYTVEILVSLAVVTGGYAAAQALHVSGPITVVVVGVLIGNRGARHAMSEETKRYLFGFWDLIDDILNATLFLLIGLEVLVFRFELSFAWIAVAAIPVVLLARFIAVAGTVYLLRPWNRFPSGSIPILVWGAVRGAISVALALSIPESEARPYILAATYSVVLFTAIGQGLTLKRLIRATR